MLLVSAYNHCCKQAKSAGQITTVRKTVKITLKQFKQQLFELT
jgi:hypothetical protein